MPVFQGAAASRKHFSQSPPGNVAVLGGSLPLQRSLEQLDRLSPAGPSSSKYTKGQSRETGSFSRSPGGVGAPAKCVSGSFLAGSGSVSLFFLGDDAGLRTIVSIEDFSKIVWMLMA